MDLINIKTHAIEIPQSKQKAKGFSVSSTTLPSFTAAVNKIIAKYQEEGFTLFRLEFVSQADDENGSGLIEPRCIVKASRLETPEETAERVARQDRYNQSQIDEHKKKIENSKRAKEIRRLTEHLTLEQLQALTKID
jgi:hypothetical protein